CLAGSTLTMNNVSLAPLDAKRCWTRHGVGIARGAVAALCPELVGEGSSPSLRLEQISSQSEYRVTIDAAVETEGLIEAVGGDEDETDGSAEIAGALADESAAALPGSDCASCAEASAASADEEIAKAPANNERSRQPGLSFLLLSNDIPSSA